MTYFLYQITLLSTIAVLAGIGIGWGLYFYYGKNQQVQSDKDLDAVKGYLAESVKENARFI